MHANSKTRRLAQMAVGEDVWLQTTLEGYPNDMRTAVVARTRRPPELANREFTTSLFTAVAAGNAGEIVYLIRLRRTA